MLRHMHTYILRQGDLAAIPRLAPVYYVGRQSSSNPLDNCLFGADGSQRAASLHERDLARRQYTYYYLLYTCPAYRLPSTQHIRGRACSHPAKGLSDSAQALLVQAVTHPQASTLKRAPNVIHRPCNNKIFAAKKESQHRR